MRRDAVPGPTGPAGDDPSPRAVATTQTLRFLERFAVGDRPRALEVGCGAGEVAQRLGEAGWQVLGIDLDPAMVASARARGVDALQADLLAFDREPFEVVLVTHSLHHISPLAAAVDRLLALVRPGGWLLVEEYDHSALDAPTASWLSERRGLLAEAGVLTGRGAPAHGHAGRGGHPHPHRERAGPPHPDAHSPGERLHTGPEMLEAIHARFEVQGMESAPYLYRYLCADLEPTPRGAQLARLALEQERRALEERQIHALGLRIAARRRP